MVRPCHSCFMNPVDQCSALVACTGDVRVFNVHFLPYNLFHFVRLPLRRLKGREVDAFRSKNVFGSSLTRELYRRPCVRSGVELVRSFLARTLYAGGGVRGRVSCTMSYVGLSGNRLPVHSLMRGMYLYRERFRHGFGRRAKCSPGRCDQVVGFGGTISLLHSASSGRLFSITVRTKCCSATRLDGRVGTLSNGAPNSFLSLPIARRAALACLGLWGSFFCGRTVLTFLAFMPCRGLGEGGKVAWEGDGDFTSAV